MHLHEELGPRATTISAIAERAGVQRLTVYRHFPDETAVFQACTAHWLSLHPPPDPAAWAGLADGMARCRAAVSAFYRYYRRTARMWEVSHHDEPHVLALQGPMAEMRTFLAGVAQDLLRTLDPPRARREATALTLRHALAFPTWASLEPDQHDDDALVAVVLAWIAGAMRGSGASANGGRGRD